MKPYKRLFEKNNDVIFDSAKDVRDHIKLKSKEYGSKNEYFSSNEYHKLYPAIKHLFDLERQDFNKNANNILKQMGLNFGDHVEYTFPTLFGGVDTYTGIIINRGNLPYVKYDKGFKDMKDRQSSLWHKGWKKINK